MTHSSRHVVSSSVLILALGVCGARAQVPAEPTLGPAPRVTDLRLLAETAAAPADAALSPIDPSDRQAVVSLYYNTYVASRQVPSGWTGSTDTCTAGTTSEAYADATMAMVNYFRAMTRLPAALPHNTAKDAKAQQAALMMSANRALSHSPPTNWKCYSADGAEAAGKSNLALGAAGPAAIALYVEDPGGNNQALGHRRWVLYPRQVEMGTGSTSNANDLWVIGNFGARPAAPDFVAWPTAGYVPYQLVYPRWSFSVNTGSSVDFSMATVVMSAGGSPIAVSQLPLANGYGDNTLGWEPAAIARGAGMADLDVTVEVRNVKVGGVTRDYRYTVTIIDPATAECTFTVTPDSASLAAAGGTATVSVTTSRPSCSWTATVGSSSPWLRLDAGGSGTGSGTVTFSASANAGGPRPGRLTIAGREVTVVQAGAPSVPVFRRYLAEGASTGFLDTRLALLNPGNLPTTALLTYQRADAAPVAAAVPVPARTRVTIDPRVSFGGQPAEFATVVESDQPLVVDRTMTWDVGGRYGAHAEMAVEGPSPTWYLAEGATHSGFDLFYLLQNPGNTPTTVRVRYLRPFDPPIEKDYDLAAHTRQTIWVNIQEFPGLGRALAASDVSAVIESLDRTPIIVERAMYLSSQGRTFNAGHESAGVTAPSTKWFLAEGATGPFFDLFVLIANPTSEAAQVRATYLLPDGRRYQKDDTVAPNSRFNIWVDLEDIPGSGLVLADTAVSTTVESTNGVPIIVERAMWWPGDFWTWHEAHNSAGATSTGTQWALAEGEVDASRNLETYILVANTSATPADVKVTLLFENGASAEQTYRDLPAHSRFNVPVGALFPEAAGRRFGAIVESLGAEPAAIVVERAMYWDAVRQPWAAGTNALATRLR